MSAPGGGPAQDIIRQRLVDRLNLAVLGPVTAVTAPAGSGKSVLVDQWAASRRDLCVVVVRLAADDDRPSVTRRAIGAVVASGAPLGADAARRLHAAGHGLARGGLTTVLGELSSAGPVVVVLDDLDAPTDPDLVADLVAVTLERRPGVHLIVTARSQRAACLTAVRRRGDIADLDHRELAFTRDEVRALVRQMTGRDLDDDQVADLLDRTEGWAVAVQLAGVALSTHADACEAIAQITGENPHIAAFLGGEVLRGLPSSMRAFLMRTSVLDPMTGPACEAVTDRSTGALTLRFLEQQGVPVHRTAPQSPVFRYSRLLREHLRHELRLSGPGAERDVLRRAARWYATHAELDAAVRYLTAAEDWAGLISLVDEHGRTWFERGLGDDVLRWMESVPESAMPDPSHHALRLGFLYSTAGLTRRSAQVLRDLEARGVDRAMQLCIDAVRASWVFVDSSPDAAAAPAERVLEGLDDVSDEELPDVLGLTDRASLRALALGALAKGTWFRGDADEGRTALRSVLAQRPLYVSWQLHLAGSVALLEAWEGNLRTAERYVGAALRHARAAGIGPHPALVDALLALGHVRRARGDLGRAMVPLQRANTIATRFRRPTMRAMYTVQVAALSLAAGEPDRGLDAIRTMREAGEPPPPPLVERQLRAETIRCLIATRQLSHARVLLPVDEVPRDRQLAPLGVALAVAEGSLDVADAELAAWPAGDTSRHGALEKDLWTAILLLKGGHRAEAVRIASDLITTSVEGGDLRVVLDAGAPGLQLLRAVLHSAPTPHARRLESLAAAQTAVVGLDLSERELEVIRYLPTPLSNAEMAARLYVSLNTLKTHLRSIYRKLGVNGRREAIRRAEELGIA